MTEEISSLPSVEDKTEDQLQRMFKDTGKSSSSDIKKKESSDSSLGSSLFELAIMAGLFVFISLPITRRILSHQFRSPTSLLIAQAVLFIILLFLAKSVLSTTTS